MAATPSEREARYTSHLREQGIEASEITIADDGTVLSTPSSARATLIDVTLPVIELRAGEPPAELGVLRTLGEGGMGKVLLAIQRPLQREVAVKVPRSADVNGKLTAELLREALVTGRLEHPNIVPVHTLGRAQDGAPFFVMKRIEGTPWRVLLDQPAELAAKVGRRAEDPLGFHLGVLLEVCNAVSFAHSRGVLHRDLKPDNVMLGSFGEVYVLDWGVAVTTGDDPLLCSAAESVGIYGTPSYMAPEMAGGDGTRLSPRTDVYLLGAVLHHVLTGRPPHGGPNAIAALSAAWEAKPPTFDERVPEELAAICRRAMAREPEERYESVLAFREAVQGFLRLRDSLALAAQAEQRLEALESSLLKKRSGQEVDPLAMQVAFTECRFAYQQVRSVPGLESTAKDGLARALTAMARGELLDENLPAARALISQLESVPELLAVELGALVERVEGRKARVAALEHLEEDADLDRAVSLRARVALLVALVCAGGMFIVSAFARAGRYSYGFPEAVWAMVLFAVALSVMEVLIRRVDTPNEAQRKLLRGNRVVLASFIVWWAGAWALRLSFAQALVGFMFHVSVCWAIASVLFDKRAWPVAAAFSAGAVVGGVLTGWEFEVLAAAIFLGFGGLAVSWRDRSR